METPEPASIMDRMSAVEKFAVDDLIEALTTFDALNAFWHLPDADQQKFVHWVATARDEAAYWGRIDALVLAMRVGPLRSETSSETAQVADRLG